MNCLAFSLMTPLDVALSPVETLIVVAVPWLLMLAAGIAVIVLIVLAAILVDMVRKNNRK